MTGKGLTSLWAYAVGEGGGSVEGVRIRRQNGQIHEFDQHYITKYYYLNLVRTIKWGQ